MALGLKTESGSGDYLPRIQYDAKAGRFFKVERTQDGGGNWSNELEELPLPVSFAADLAGIEVGWIKLDGGVDFQMVHVGEDLPPQPSDKHRQGFRVRIYSKSLGVRHWNHTAKCVLQVMDEVHTKWQAEQKNGKLPVLHVAKTVPVITGSGAKKSTNYAPVVEIAKWITRPDEFDAPVAEEVPPPDDEEF